MSLVDNLCDPEWIMRLVTGYVFHVNKYRISGFMIDYTPDGPNTIFVLAVSLLLAEYQLWPITLKKPPLVFSMVLEGLLAQFWTNVARSLVWIPFTKTLRENLRGVSKTILLLNSKLKFHKRSLLCRLAGWLNSESTFTTISMLVAVGVLIWVLHATDTLEQMKRMMSCYLPMLCEPKSKCVTPRIVICSETHTPISSGNLLYKARATIYSILKDINVLTPQGEDSEPPGLELHASNVSLSGSEPVTPINDEHQQQ